MQEKHLDMQVPMRKCLAHVEHEIWDAIEAAERGDYHKMIEELHEALDEIGKVIEATHKQHGIKHEPQKAGTPNPKGIY